MDKGRLVGGFIAAVLVTVTVASFAHTHFTIQALRAVGAEVPPSVAMETVGGDIVGLAPSFGAVIAIALLLGFVIAGLVRRFVRLPRPIAFALAGGAALATALSVIPGVVEHGLFIGLASVALIGKPDGSVLALEAETIPEEDQA